MVWDRPATIRARVVLDVEIPVNLNGDVQTKMLMEQCTKSVKARVGALGKLVSLEMKDVTVHLSAED